jgi:hypothetical protein
MTRLAPFLCALLLATPLLAQRFQWHADGGYEGIANSYDGATDIAKDGLGRLHMFDYASGTQLCQGVRVTAYSADRANYSTFLYTFDGSGDLVRALVIGEDMRAMAIEAGADGSTYILGRSSLGRLIVGEDTAAVRANSNILLKITKDGALAWHTVVFPNSGGAETMLLLHGDRLYVQSGPTSIAQLDTTGATIRTITASYYRSQTAILQLIFRGAHAFSNGDVLLAAISFGNVAFGADTLKTRNNTFLAVPMLMMRVGADLSTKWYRYPVQGLRNIDVKSIPLAIDENDNIYVGLQVADTCVVGTDTLVRRDGAFSGGLAKLDGNGLGQWGQVWGSGILPWALALRPNGTGVAVVGRASGTTPLGQFSVVGSFGKALYALVDSDGNADLATLAVNGNFGSAAQGLVADTNGTYIIGGLLNGGDGVPLYSCTSGDRIRGFFLGRISEEPDSVPTPIITQVGDSLVASPRITGDVQWFLDGQPITDASSFSIRIGTNGRYTVRYTYTTGCVGSATSNATTVTTSSVDEADPDRPLSVYPNPVQDVVQVPHTMSDLHRVEIVDLNGRIVDVWETQPGPVERSVTGLPHGVYQLRLIGRTRVEIAPFVKY